MVDHDLFTQKEGEDLVAEPPLGREGIDVGDGDEPIVAGPTVPGHEGVDVRVGIDAIAEGLPLLAGEGDEHLVFAGVATEAREVRIPVPQSR